MGPIETILLLTLLGFLMLAAEAFVPGLILGLLGAVCLLAAVGVSYAGFGLLPGTLTLAAIALVTTAGFVAWMQLFPHTAIGRRIMLHQSLPPGRSNPLASLLGQEGSALTPLRPSGTAVFQGRKVDVSSENDFIAAGDPVIVVREDGMSVVVRRKA
jgi:membrane-bound serine protease (ClpP class)